MPRHRRLVAVTIAGQTLAATPSAGGWSVTSAILANGTYPVVASVEDGAGNQGSATQDLTIDTVLPLVTIDGGPTVTTNDPTPTITGSSDQAPGTVVGVSFGSSFITALVQPAGTWNVTPTALSDGTRTVVAAVTDPAGNVGSAGQVVSIDTAAPALGIAGGANALTNDPTPQISGMADASPGTIVTVALADQTLTGPVQGGGAWSVTAAALPDGPHRVVASVADEAGNPASSTQTLSVDTVAPLVAITGGATARTSDLDPTIAGTSDAAPGTTVTASIAGQTMTTLVQADGTWNATTSFAGGRVAGRRLGSGCGRQCGTRHSDPHDRSADARPAHGRAVQRGGHGHGRSRRQTAGPGLPALDRHEGDRPRPGPRGRHGERHGEDPGPREGDQADPRHRDGRSRPERDAEAQAEGRQDGGPGGIPEDQGRHRLGQEGDGDDHGQARRRRRPHARGQADGEAHQVTAAAGPPREEAVAAGGFRPVQPRSSAARSLRSITSSATSARRRRCRRV